MRHPVVKEIRRDRRRRGREAFLLACIIVSSICVGVLMGMAVCE